MAGARLPERETRRSLEGQSKKHPGRRQMFAPAHEQTRRRVSCRLDLSFLAYHPTSFIFCAFLLLPPDQAHRKEILAPGASSRSFAFSHVPPPSPRLPAPQPSSFRGLFPLPPLPPCFPRMDHQQPRTRTVRHVGQEMGDSKHRAPAGMKGRTEGTPPAQATCRASNGIGPVRACRCTNVSATSHQAAKSSLPAPSLSLTLLMRSIVYSGAGSRVMNLLSYFFKMLFSCSVKPLIEYRSATVL